MAQIDKNNVPAANQLKKNFVFPENPTGTGPRVLFVGNSITLHGVAPHIGWLNLLLATLLTYGLGRIQGKKESLENERLLRE